MTGSRISVWRAAAVAAAVGALFASMLTASASGAPGDATATQVANINPGGNSNPDRFFNLNGTLFFTADDGTHGQELWKSDGTTAMMVENAGDPGSGINAGSSSFPRNPIDVNGTLFFRANDGTNGEELWKSVAPYATATMVEDAVADDGINPAGNSSPSNLTNVNGTLFFSADDGTNGRELWKYDGTNPATMVEDAVAGGGINPGGGGSDPSQPVGLINFNGTLIFNATDGTNGEELWKYNGTNPATMVVGGGGIHPTGSSVPSLKTIVNGTLFFSANDGTNGRELWKYDGTNPPTMVDDDTVPDGGINPGNGFADPGLFTNVNGTLFFYADDGANGIELWKSDGTPSGTTMIDDDPVPDGGINPGAGSSNPDLLINLNGTLFFIADDGANGFELWRTDGTIATMIEDAVAGGGINPGAADSFPNQLTNVNGTLFFSANDGNGFELWRTDGTIATMIEDAVAGGGINPGADSFPGFLTNVNGTLFFIADDGTNGNELWKSDGTIATIVEDAVAGGGINPGSNASDPSRLTNVNGTLFFRADDGTTGAELWKATVEPAPPLNPITPTTSAPTTPAKKRCKKGRKLKKGKCVKKKRKKKRR